MKTPKIVKEDIVIPAPNMQIIEVNIKGTAPYVQHRFSQKVMMEMLNKQIAGGTAKSKKNIKSRNVDQDYKDATHLGEDGQYGIPAAAFRSAMISACRVVGFQMTKAKLSVFIISDTIDVEDGSPLVHIEGKPELHKAAVRLATGVASIAIRPMWREWSAKLRIQWDADQFEKNDVINLLMRAGIQVGVGEGRPDSKKSHGMGWGTFEIIQKEVI